MEVNELINKSPIRVFEESINGGLGRGNLGVLTSPRGVGKTACMVHLAIDKILQGSSIIHVSFDANLEHIMTWYNEVSKQITGVKGLDDTMEVYEAIRKNKVMMNFPQENTSVDTILSSLEALITAGAYKADALFFDGYKMTVATEDDVKKIKAFAKKMNVEVWFSVSPVRDGVEFDAYGVPSTLKPYINDIDVLVGLNYNDDKNRIIMTVEKDHGNTTAHSAGTTLDPKTMLIAG